MARDRNSFSSAEGLGTEERIFISHIDDMLKICEKTGTARFSSFLSEAESALVRRYLEYCAADNYMLYGGYENAQRVILGVFPQYEEPSEEAFPIQAVCFVSRMADLSHRDYLGAIMSLGITRSLVGDIICGEKTYAMLAPAAADMAVIQITKIGRAGVRCTLSQGEKIVRNDSFARISATVASLRLDCILSSAVKVSRDKAAQLIRSGMVSVNHTAAVSVSEQLKEGDVLSVRGHGRFVIGNIGDRTKKDRIHITINKYL